MTADRSTPTLLFAVNGMGLGNSTRSLAVIQALWRAGHSANVATFGNGLEFFREKAGIRNVFPLHPVGYARTGSKLSGRGILSSSLPFLINGIRNEWRLLGLVRTTKAECVILDSCYGLLLKPFSRARIISINNADKIVLSALGRRRLPISCWAQMMVELSDFLYHRIVPSAVISPWFVAPSEKRRGVYTIEPIVRIGYLQRAQPPKEIKKIVVIYSGSGLGEDMHSSLVGQSAEVTVIGRTGRNAAGIRFLKNVVDTSQVISGCDLLVINGGFSSISEGLALRRPMLVVPIEGHAEQRLNAEAVERLGLGRLSTAENVRATLKSMSDQLADFVTAYERIRPSCGGARQAAEIIQRITTIEKNPTGKWRTRAPK